FSVHADTSASGAPDPYRGNNATRELIGITEDTTPTTLDDPSVCPGTGLTIDDATLLRPATGTADMTFAVHLSEARAFDLDVGYRTVKGTAVPVEDFTAPSG